MYKWLTPDNAPDGTRCIVLIVPFDEEFEALVRGALAPLMDAENFEQFGSLTPAETADYFQQAFVETMQWLECP